MEKDVFLKLLDIQKIFPGVTALDGVSMDVRKGEVHALCGENGAGKSTLMKIISGAQPYTSGQIMIEGKEKKFSSTKEAENEGISMIYQEFNMAPELTAAENILMGELPVSRIGILDWKEIYSRAQKILESLGVKFSVRIPVKNLSVAEIQMCEIARAVNRGNKLIIMDEPTAALSKEESETLFSLINQMKESGMSIIYVSHRMDEIFNISDRITVFRNGKYIRTLDTDETDYHEIVGLMVGREISNLYPERVRSDTSALLELKNINGKNVKDISFTVNKGEILGITGLLGAGNIEICKMAYGAVKMDSGDIFLNNKKVNNSTPAEALSNGIGFLSDDRKKEGLVLIRNISENINMSSIEENSSMGIMNRALEKERTTREVRNLNIKISSPEQMTINLSGGNQQKVALGKVLERNPEVYFFLEPTRGVDVGAKEEIYKIMNNMTENGKSIVLSSSDLPEIVGMSDRVLVFRDGTIVKELNGEEINQENILFFASGGTHDE